MNRIKGYIASLALGVFLGGWGMSCFSDPGPVGGNVLATAQAAEKARQAADSLAALSDSAKAAWQKGDSARAFADTVRIIRRDSLAAVSEHVAERVAALPAEAAVPRALHDSLVSTMTEQIDALQVEVTTVTAQRDSIRALWFKTDAALTAREREAVALREQTRALTSALHRANRERKLWTVAAGAGTVMAFVGGLKIG